MNESPSHREPGSGTTRRLAVAAIVMSIATGAVGQVAQGAPLPALYQRFEVDPSGGWVTVALRLDPGAWRTGGPDGPPVTAQRWSAALGALNVLAIGTHCVPIVRGETSYPCSFSLAQPALGGDAPSDSAVQGWRSTSGETLRNFVSQEVSAISTPLAPAPPPSLNVAPDFIGLLAPPAFLDRVRGQVAASKATVLRFRIRCSSSPAGNAAARFGHGLVILGTELPEPVAPAVGRDRV